MQYCTVFTNLLVQIFNRWIFELSVNGLPRPYSRGRQVSIVNVCSDILDLMNTTTPKHIVVYPHYVFSVNSIDFTVNIALLKPCFINKLYPNMHALNDRTLYCSKFSKR